MRIDAAFRAWARNRGDLGKLRERQAVVNETMNDTSVLTWTSKSQLPGEPLDGLTPASGASSDVGNAARRHAAASFDSSSEQYCPHDGGS